MEIKSVI